MENEYEDKVFFKKQICRDYKLIGYIQLVIYEKTNIPYIEYKISNKEYKNKGIMSLEIKEYLKECKNKNIIKLIAQVNKNNIASIKILEKNNFINLKQFKDILIYGFDSRFSKEQLETSKIKLKDTINNLFK